MGASNNKVHPKREEKEMGMKYCPHCKKVVDARTLPYFTQIPWKGILIKKRRAIHMVEHGGCGLTWYTVEMPAKMLGLPDKE
jgi:hypothetical protein